MWLLYCVFRAKISERDLPQGVDGRPVIAVCNNGLGAVISQIPLTALSPTIPRLEAYQRVVETLHRNRTVIPMRYGCVCEIRAQALQLLKDRGEEYRALLDKIGDCVEMGIRLLLPQALSVGLSRDGAGPDVRSPGRAYLETRRERYAAQNRDAAEEERLVEVVSTNLRGLFADRRSEVSSSYQDRLVSLYFLVPRNRVDTFRRAFRDLRVSGSTKLLLTGPWPPYNFVLGIGNQSRQGGCEFEG